ncbi:MAG: alcohol dehydrogenase catalytic domain-containing protein [Thermoplasmata archaeon]|uniref:Alcohol dehydrogenase catalytic domain-containing protein n=1 Tax=Candidatus Sysuiplasma superficiale TaxID=2823368 RepID=A0A8J7YPA8_9ARCH|nr:alcohol dehydrogenase catalytic domain-containing protein [Candidatus Sysuiplasma superficiale]MBX8643590.1 alcohol dehydrogenase catalytic domain-containing protein [Candidatus Sysuiplasma superficiale]
MKTCTVGNRNNLVISEQEVPKISDDEILVEMRACGICGTDVEKIRGNYSSRILGHEAVGIVASTGKNVSNFKAGDRVFPHHHVPCYECHYCMSGSETMCPQFSKSNLDPGGLSEFFRVPAWNIKKGGVFRLPEGLGFRTATMIEPLACVLRGLGKIPVSGSDTVGIVGVGPVGMMHVTALKIISDCRIVAVDISEDRLKFASLIGADMAVTPADAVREVELATGGIGADVVFVASGSSGAIGTGIKMLRKGGKMIQFGLPPPNTHLPADYSEIFKREISIMPTYSAVEREVAAAIEMIASHQAEFSRLISDVFGLEDAEKAFNIAEKGEAARKIIIERGEN